MSVAINNTSDIIPYPNLAPGPSLGLSCLDLKEKHRAIIEEAMPKIKITQDKMNVGVTIFSLCNFVY